MLKSVDTLIGFSLIMLAISMSVTLIIQWIVYITAMRGKKLLEGITDLIHHLDPQLLTLDHAQEIATQVLTHRMLTPGAGGLAEVVHREELVKILLELGSNPDSAARQALAAALTNLGISNPSGTLNAVNLLAMRLEASHPELASHVREATAVITEAGSQFVAKINSWFDPTIDRVSESFTTYSRYWTVVISLLLAVCLQIDSFKIINRLSIDDSLRASLVQSVRDPQMPPPSTPLEKQTQDNVMQLRNLASDQLITWPAWPIATSWINGWKQSSFFGILLTGALLSLGAPFWFNMLSNLVKLRPLLAAKDDEQRKDRESSQSRSSATAVALVSSSGDRGAPG
jgi:hypothetical protein